MINLEPNNNDNVYIVCSDNSIGVQHIIGLIWRYLTNSQKPYVLSAHGDVIPPSNREVNDNYRWISTARHFKQIPLRDSMYKHVAQKDASVPFIINEDNVPDCTEIKNLFPNAHLIIIKYDLDDLSTIAELKYKHIYLDGMKGTEPKDGLPLLENPTSQILQFYTNPTIPDNLKDRSLVLNFKDMFTPALLDTLSSYLGLPTSQYLIDIHTQVINANSV